MHLLTTYTTTAEIPLSRVVIGGVLRDVRLQKRLTLRTVAEAAPAALGYLSEVERGIKEPSSEVLGGIVTALGIPLSELFREASYRLQMSEQLTDTQLHAQALAPQRM